MTGYEVKNAIITRTMLGIEDHGIFTAGLTLDYGGLIQSYGGYALDDKPVKPYGDRVAGTAAGEFISGVFKVTGKGSWEKLPGTPVRAYFRHTAVKSLGHYLKDLWLVWKDGHFVVVPFAEIPDGE